MEKMLQNRGRQVLLRTYVEVDCLARESRSTEAEIESPLIGSFTQYTTMESRRRFDAASDLALA